SVEKFKGLENQKIPPEFDYSKVPGLSNELTKKLSSIRPVSIGQARRISGMTQAALTAVLVYMKRFGENKNSGIKGFKRKDA
ncbi:MAG: tRNA uridine-5-carboxymethylaminomethyl(34) synthesis enzyme MnmG, partial [Thermodesulfobacteriota bacterium]|nr:tRNA uridine-5-carboxymethylaminomethyl(34) synthesis enzyme MnmG [Thermodesulfobacteriota bacterium]